MSVVQNKTPVTAAFRCKGRAECIVCCPRGLRQAAERSLTELKEFAAQLKALPHIQRHIGLAEAVNRAIAAPAFRARVAVEQQLLDGHGIDAAAEAIDVRARMLLHADAHAVGKRPSKGSFICGCLACSLLRQWLCRR